MPCPYQVFGIERQLEIKGWGDCNTCVPNQHNGDCRGHFEIVVRTFEVDPEAEVEEAK